MNTNLHDWVYTARLEQVIARFKLAQGKDRDNMISAIRSATLRSIDNNDHARSSDLISAFPNMRHWETADDRHLKAKDRKARFYSLLRAIVGAFMFGAVLFAIRAYGFSLGPFGDARLVYWLTGISIVLNCLGWHFQAHARFDERGPNSSSMENKFGEWLSIAGAGALGLALLSSLIQLVWLV